MRIGWIGFHLEGILALRCLLEQGTRIEAVITLKSELAFKRSGHADYASLCRTFQVPLYEIANMNDHESIELLQRLSLDLVFVIGWSQIIRPEALKTAKMGMIGAHASRLPHNRGSAPVNWALIKGEQETGNSLIWLAEEVDAGHIIDQTAIPISGYDTCTSIYERVAESNRDMILKVIPRLLAGERPGRPQPETNEPVLPRRRPKDGLIPWSQDAHTVYNFVRALTKPYPGAFSWLERDRCTIWKSAVLSLGSARYGEAGQVLGPVISPERTACGQAVACGSGILLLLSIEKPNEEVLEGYQLSDQMWAGKVWKNE